MSHRAGLGPRTACIALRERQRSASPRLSFLHLPYSLLNVRLGNEILASPGTARAPRGEGPRSCACVAAHAILSPTLAESTCRCSGVPRECFLPRTRRAPPGVCVVCLYRYFVHPLDAVRLPLFIARTVLLTLWARSHCGSSPVAFLSFARPPTVLYICICGCGERCSTLSVGWQAIS